MYVAPCVAYAQLVSSLHRESERYAKLIRMCACACACACAWHLRLFVKFSLTFVVLRTGTLCFMMRYMSLHTHTDTDMVYTHLCMAGTGQRLCWLLPENDSKRAGEGGRGSEEQFVVFTADYIETDCFIGCHSWLVGWEAGRLTGCPSTIASVGFLTCRECICVPCVGWRLGSVCVCVGRPLTAGWFLDLHC